MIGSKPKTLAGECAVWMFGITSSFLLMLGLTLGAARILDCNPNAGGVGTCMLGPVDMMGLLTFLGILGAFGTYIISPFLIGIGLLSGIVCLFRRKW